MKPAVLLAFGLGLAGGLQAQTMYKCTGADGKTVFSDRPCPSNAAKQETRAGPPAASQAEVDAEIARRYGARPEDIAALRAQCAAGHKRTCGELDRLMGATAAEIQARAEKRAIEEKKVKDRKDALAQNRELCRKGDQAACDRVQQLLAEERPDVPPSDYPSSSYRRRR